MMMVVGPEAEQVSHNTLVAYHASGSVQVDVIDGINHKLEEVGLELVQGREVIATLPIRVSIVARGMAGGAADVFDYLDKVVVRELLEGRESDIGFPV